MFQEPYIYIYIHLNPLEKMQVRLIFSWMETKIHKLIFLECTPRWKCVENDIGWPGS